MITHILDSSAGPVRQTLGLSNLVLFFSLPFRPVGKRNHFCNGHIALGVEGTIYQVYDPGLLKTSFLFSRMPALDWLFGNGGSWVDRDPSSPRFTHVYLYGRCETRRTVVYYAAMEVDSAAIRHIRADIAEKEDRFRRGESRFTLFSDNCSSMVAGALEKVGLVEPSPVNRVPVRLFKRLVRRSARDLPVRVGKVAAYDGSAFELHRYCIGSGILHPEKAVDRWIAEEPDRYRARQPRWAPRAAAVEAKR